MKGFSSESDRKSVAVELSEIQELLMQPDGYYTGTIDEAIEKLNVLINRAKEYGGNSQCLHTVECGCNKDYWV